MTRILARLTVLVFAIGISISAFAGSTKTDTITLYHDAQLNGTTIPAGDSPPSLFCIVATMTGRWINCHRRFPTVNSPQQNLNHRGHRERRRPSNPNRG